MKLPLRIHRDDPNIPAIVKFFVLDVLAPVLFLVLTPVFALLGRAEMKDGKTTLRWSRHNAQNNPPSDSEGRS